jgi:hypothetical protein
MEFWQWLLLWCASNPFFMSFTLLADKAEFTCDCIMKSHNHHLWVEVTVQGIILS